MRKRRTFLGSAFSVLLLFSVISYGESLMQQQPKRSDQASNPAGNPASSTEEGGTLEVPSNKSAADPAKTSGTAGKSSEASTEEKIAVAARVFTATAYSLRGRTASGRPVSRGLIAADPTLLPLGTRVRVEAGSFRGDYLVADTGGAVRGRRIDIWTPTAREAMQFGRRAVKLTVLSFGIGRNKNNRQLQKDKTTSPSPAK